MSQVFFTQYELETAARAIARGQVIRAEVLAALAEGAQTSVHAELDEAREEAHNLQEQRDDAESEVERLTSELDEAESKILKLQNLVDSDVAAIADEISQALAPVAGWISTAIAAIDSSAPKSGSKAQTWKNARQVLNSALIRCESHQKRYAEAAKAAA